MKLVLYANENNGAGAFLRKTLATVIEPHISKDSIEIYCAFETLFTRLQRLTAYDFCIAVLLVDTRKMLSDLLSINNPTTHFQIILILPDREKETLQISHQLCPRYISYTDGDFMDVAAVLKKMVARFHKKQRNEGTQ